MNRLQSLIILIVFGLLGVGIALAFYSRNPTTTPVIKTVQTPSPALEQKAEVITEPRNISIPKINVSADIESVGQDNEGKMDVPKGVFNVGWYNLGFKPGEKGSAVMAGHLDTITGAPAVFYNIGQLQPGDEVSVTDKNGEVLTFEVTKVQSYPFDKVPLQEVFASQDKPRLNLITCVGTWDIGTSNYSERLVVYTELKS